MFGSVVALLSIGLNDGRLLLGIGLNAMLVLYLAGLLALVEYWRCSGAGEVMALVELEGV